MTIFISIASYRDPQLVPTIEDCLAKARHPDQLRFGICWQHGDEEPALPFASDPRFHILDVPWRESRGACWARAELMKLYAGEDYFLQLDSHHRFAPDWDVRAIAQLERTGSAKPVLTAYVTPFVPDDPAPLGGEPLQMDFDRFTEEGIVLFRSSVIERWRERDRPVRARFLSAHFLFAPGAFVREVPYDPELYFIGEELTLAVRAFTHGWDLFHPIEVLAWHEYTRAYRPHKHWSDHTRDNGVETEWHQRDAESKARIARFLADPKPGPFGLGTARTLADYEAYAGLDFRRRRVQGYTRARDEPPNPPAPEGWAERIARYDLALPIERAMLVPEALRPSLWYVAVHDAQERELARADASREEVAALLAADTPTVVVRRRFELDREPASWTVWPIAEDGRWLDKIRGEIVIRPPAPTTFVTALLDLGRDALAPSYARSFEEHYLTHFEVLLRIDAPLVVYADPAHHDFIWSRRRRENTRVESLTRGDLESSPHFARLTELRTDPAWRAQAAWLAESPQAQLPHYLPLVLSKLPMVRDVASQNPFGTDAFFWIDAGLHHTVAAPLLLEPSLPARLGELAKDEPVFLAWPYEGAEVHGFPAPAMTRFAGGEVRRVVRGGLFGARRDALVELATRYDALLRATLDAGLVGTEESLFALLAKRHPELVRPYLLRGDGLVAPFFEAVREGRAGSLRAPVEPAVPGLVASDPEGARTGETRFIGLPMQQNRNAAFALDALWKHLEAGGTPVRRVIELGTGGGGFSVLLQLCCLGSGARFVTYDADARAQRLPAFAALGIEQRNRDLRHDETVAEIARELAQPGLTVLVCDGGDKIGDATRFADHLKPGDVLLVHDYAASREVYERDVRGRLWSWCEVTDADLREASERNGLRELLPEIMHAAVWTARRKEGTARPSVSITGERAALYVLTYDAPAQLERWLRAAEEGDPELLERTERFLWNNSTDRTTDAAYDALCARYGFHQIRRGNLGITGGRIACAHHFEEHTRLDAMFFFEDDMLINAATGLCANGMTRRVPRLHARAMEILRSEPGLDFLKLSYSEHFGDHRHDWAYFNLDDAGRARWFPEGHATRVRALRSHDGLSYAVGEIFYSNWPMVISRRGSATLFPQGTELPRHEAGLMVRGLELLRAERLRSGVLLASPILHRRDHTYPADRRKES